MKIIDCLSWIDGIVQRGLYLSEIKKIIFIDSKLLKHQKNKMFWWSWRQIYDVDLPLALDYPKYSLFIGLKVVVFLIMVSDEEWDIYFLLCIYNSSYITALNDLSKLLIYNHIFSWIDQWFWPHYTTHFLQSQKYSASFEWTVTLDAFGQNGPIASSLMREVLLFLLLFWSISSSIRLQRIAVVSLLVFKATLRK